jgi:uncharacterized protein YegL
MSLEEKIEFVRNSEPRCPVVLILDSSDSMEGDRISQLNAGVMTFKQEVERDPIASLRVEVAIVSFNNSVSIVQDFITVYDFVPTQLSTNGMTAMGQAIEVALDMLEERRSIYRDNGIASYQPWAILITDGKPTDSWQGAATRVRQAIADRKVNFYVIGVQGANMNILREIASPNVPPVMLQGLKFQELFRWISVSLRRVSCSRVGEDQVELPPITGWAQANT